MKKLYRKGTYILLLFIGLVLLGCKDDDDTNVLPVIANFSFTLEGNTVTFLNSSEEATAFEWNFGDGSTSTEINPIKVYASGTFTITLTASNDIGATDTFEDEVTIVSLEQIVLPITFDDATVANEATVFGGTSFEVLENPNLNGTNETASNVGAITNSGAEFEGVFFDLGEAVDLTDDKTIEMSFWSDVAVALLLKLEQPDGTAIETTATHTGIGWEQLLFTFNSSNSYSRFTFFIDGPGTTAGTFFIDNIAQIETPPAGSGGCTETLIGATTFPVDFEGCETFPADLNFGNGVTSDLVTNPFQTGINTSDFVLQVNKPAGSEFFAGIQNIFPNNFDLTTTDTFVAKIYSTKPNVVFRFELLANPNDGSIGNPVPIFITIPNANEWVELQFTFENLPASPTAYNQLVIKPDNDQTDSAITQGGTYFIDDIDLISTGNNDDGNGGGGTGSNFDSGILINGDFASGMSPWEGSGANVQTEGGNNFNFADVTTEGEAFSVNLSQPVEIVQGTNYILTFDASSDRERTILAGIGLNEAPFTNTAPAVSLSTTTQTFNLQLAASNFGDINSRVLFDMGAEIGTVAIDNVSLVTGGDGRDSNGGNPPEEASGGCDDTLVAATSLPLNFEGCETFPVDLNFGNGITSALVVNPFQTGINTSEYVLQVDKPAGSDFFAGIQNIFPNNFDLRTSATFSTKVYSTKANVVFRFELLANPNDGSIGNPVPVFVNIPNANEWTEVIVTFENLPASPTAYSQLVIKPDNNQTDSAITTDGTYYIDDILFE